MQLGFIRIKMQNMQNVQKCGNAINVRPVTWRNEIDDNSNNALIGHNTSTPLDKDNRQFTIDHFV